MDNFVFNKNEETATWIYEYNLWKNSTIFLTIWKIFILCALVPAFVVLFSTIEDSFIDELFTFLKVVGLIIVIISIILFITYVIVCLINGGKYIVIFEMDNLGIKHIQMDKQFVKAQGIVYIGTIIGATKKDLITIGTNLLANSKNYTYSKFKRVKEIKSNKKRNTIKIRTSNGYNNQIYVDNKHYDTILKMIIDKCPKNIIVSINKF